jgi:hypothetical protein
MTIPGLSTITGALGGLFGEGSLARQFFVWGFLSNIVDVATAPFQQELRDKVMAANPVVPLSPADLADMVVRGVAGQDWATDQAKRSGISPELFALMVRNTGEPPALQEMLSLFRRGETDQATLDHAIRESRVRDEWIPLVHKMGLDLPTPIDILTARLKGQIDDATARDLYRKLGGDEQYFQLLYDTRGEGPTPNEAATMARRGIIPWDGLGPGVTSYAQAVFEGMFRNKWGDAFRALAAYVPPPRTVTALYKEHALTPAQAQRLFEQAGLSPELAGAFLQSASNVKTQAHRNLAISTIEALYVEHAIDRAEALDLLTLLGYDRGEAEFILLVNDMKRYEKFFNTAVSSVHTQYVGHKIGAPLASNILDGLGLAHAERDSLLSLWLLERGARVKRLTDAQVKKATSAGLITPDQAIARLTEEGYSQEDAALYMQL